jgi:hypothetical protein
MRDVLTGRLADEQRRTGSIRGKERRWYGGGRFLFRRHASMKAGGEPDAGSGVVIVWRRLPVAASHRQPDEGALPDRCAQGACGAAKAGGASPATQDASGAAGSPKKDTTTR